MHKGRRQSNYEIGLTNLGKPAEIHSFTRSNLSRTDKEKTGNL